MISQKIKYLYKYNKEIKRVLVFAFVLLVIIVLAPLLANDKPLVCIYKQQVLFPAFSFKNQCHISDNEIINYDMGKDWKQLNTNFILFPLCAYSPKTIDADNPYKSPFSKQCITHQNQVQSLPFKHRHWLGTTQTGTDVLSGLIHGTKTSIGVGFWSACIAGFIGVFLGAMAGYFGNNQFKIGITQLAFTLIALVMAVFYVFIFYTDGVFISIENVALKLELIVTFVAMLGMLFNVIGKKIDLLFNTKNQFTIPVDLIITKWIEVINTIPSLLIIVAVASIVKPSYSLLIVLIGLLSCTSVARVVRAEYFKAKELNYVMAYKAMGFKEWDIMLKKILPNIFPIITVQLVFVMASAILIESSLSFIGVGIPMNDTSWGSLLAEAREKFSAWWLVIFPGTCIFSVLYVCNKWNTSFQQKTNYFNKK